VSEANRARILAAARELVRERGYPGLEVDHLVARAKVSRKTFYELLEGREQCFQIVLEDTVMRLANVLRDAFAAAEPSPSWMSLRAALGTLLAFIEDEPGLGSALILDAPGAGPNVRAYRAQVLNELTAIVNEVRTHPPNPEGAPESTEAPPPARESTDAPPLATDSAETAPRASEAADAPLPLTAEWVVAGALGMIQSRLVELQLSGADSPAPFADLLNPLMALAVLPYIGRPAAEQELYRPAGAVQRTWESQMADPLPDLGMRITYRRLAVLGAIAGTPGLSSREVREQAGMKSEAQASRMLARLEQLGVIENTTGSRISGRPKSWRLTERGEQTWQGLRGR
jgi:AcrR family transcriptional regulator